MQNERAEYKHVLLLYIVYLGADGSKCEEQLATLGQHTVDPAQRALVKHLRAQVAGLVAKSGGSVQPR